MIQTTFTDRAVMAELVAKMLWEIKAVHFNAAQPYKFASGMASPVYIDCRKLLSFPRVRSTVMDFAASVVLRDAGFEQFDCVAGGETAGIPFAALLADRLSLPMIYVRKQPKGHGRNAQIEGNMPEGARVLVIEDLTTAGGSMFTLHRCRPGRRRRRRSRHSALLLRHLRRRRSCALPMARSSCTHIATWRDVLAVAEGAEAVRRQDAERSRSLPRCAACLVGTQRWRFHHFE